MSQIGTLAAAPAITVIAGQAEFDQYLLIGDVGTPLPLLSLTVEIDGESFININNLPDILTAIAEWQQETIGGATPGFLLKLATGNVKKNTTIRLANSGATTPPIKAWSEAGNGNGVPLEMGSKTINATSYETFDKFSALFVEHVNVANFEIVFSDGTRSTMTLEEVAAMYNMKFQTEANGFLGTSNVVAIDNTDSSIVQVKINTASSGTVATVKVKIPDAAFEVFKKMIR
jgi:hypothetical protein